MKNKAILIALVLLSHVVELRAQTDTLLKVSKIITNDTVIYYKNGNIQTKVEIRKGIKSEWNYYESGVLFVFKVTNHEEHFEYIYDCKGLLYSFEYRKNKSGTRTIYGLTCKPIYIASIQKSEEKVVLITPNYDESLATIRFDCLPQYKGNDLPSFKY